MWRVAGIALVTGVLACGAGACAFQSTLTRSPAGAGATVGEIQIDVREEARLKEGVPGASIELVNAANENWDSPLRHVAADSAGHASFARLAPARYTIRAWAAGHDTVTQRLNVGAGDIQSVRISLRSDRCVVVVTSSGPVCM
jgi:hypothetical protein